MKIETNNLVTVKNYASKQSVTPTYVYKLIREKRMEHIVIDGVQFIDITKYPVLPTKQ
jgi:hypothetical protein